MTDNDALSLFIRLSDMFFRTRSDLMAGLDFDDILDALMVAVSLCIMGMSLCRVGQLGCQHRVSMKAAYVMLFTGAFCKGAWPWLSQGAYPRGGDAIFASAAVYYMLLNGRAWVRGRPPKDHETAPAPLSEA